ncbi:lysylphosphatidylglycerol synthase transmembrane domain-containing protein [Galbibacter sp. EGI 63066]|uniref:lysylphosphatidylglycerol synthase transmembrane domain-containing protein n=1 Tax=Galbibacter sp. EGI 63066 TaxID=2993559 RepID=UPI0022494559|nr:lysylphosphatidylglycerol synthase transmembrane domain-containing protein [Galbibacter sp. EGI 63066]MCX2682092.1 lysylphosphatidylglycerol synthase transmembrane domain-containing protein [Galbibacter sp. EGI 63066]
MKKTTKKALSSLIKIGISLLLLYLVYTKTDFKEIYRTLLKTDFPHLLLAILSFITSQIVSSYRLNYLLHHNQLPLSPQSNLKLYLLGMFYNFFIPGGIGGDAYKVYILNSTFEWQTKKVLKTVFLDRLVGLIAILLFILLIITILPAKIFPLEGEGYRIFFIIATILSVFLSEKVMTSFFELKKTPYYHTLLYSVLIQLLQVLSVVFIMKSMHINPENFFIYILIFLISSVLSIFSFAGIGVREYLFLQASTLFSLDETTAVSIGVVFSVITAIVSCLGIYYHFKKIQLKLKTI